MIKIENVSKFYGSHQVLKDVNLNFMDGRVYGIVGENGSGKTTLFRCIAGLEKYHGNITTHFDKLKNHLGFLMTEPFFFSKITGREYLQLLANARTIKLSDVDERNIFELPLHQYASTYSTGMKKKLALLAILLQPNDCYILDEPYNGVDIQSNILITQIIHRLRELGKTVVISSHIFSTLRDTCDEIHLLHQGRIIQTAGREHFDQLVARMKASTTGNKIEKLKLG
ncbi:MAG: ABC transporter ATP-binding protein [Bacteroidales bacterium]|nr:ABC transporter ATP-binding protein [Bacteroidales bacterium]